MSTPGPDPGISPVAVRDHVEHAHAVHAVLQMGIAQIQKIRYLVVVLVLLPAAETTTSPPLSESIIDLTFDTARRPPWTSRRISPL